MLKNIYNKKTGGFSLLELMVVIVIIGGIITMAMPSLGILTGSEIKKEITRIAGMMNEIYDRAALTGKTHRVVFDLDNNQYWAEEKTGDASLFAPEIGHELEISEKQVKKKLPEQKYKPVFLPVEGILGEKNKLKDSLKIYGLWVDGADEPVRTGNMAIYFFSGGYTQSAFVSLSAKNAEKADLFISITPLTGEISTGNGEPLPSDLTENNE